MSKRRLSLTVDADLDDVIRLYAEKTHRPLSLAVEHLVRLGLEQVEHYTGGSIIERDTRAVIEADDKLALDWQRW
jgi:hypothetical protein